MDSAIVLTVDRREGNSLLLIGCPSQACKARLSQHNNFYPHNLECNFISQNILIFCEVIELCSIDTTHISLGIENNFHPRASNSLLSGLVIEGCYGLSLPMMEEYYQFDNLNDSDDMTEGAVSHLVLDSGYGITVDDHSHFASLG